MQINRVGSGQTDINKSRINKETANKTSFKGLGFVDTVALGTADLIENGGLAVSFTLQDMIGTNLPRPLMGLRRNAKENKGEKNLKFAAKEMVREFMTGPSMFLIPMGMLAAGKRLIGNSIQTPMHLIKAFGDIHAAAPVDEAGKAISKTEFYKNTFTEIIKNAKAETEISEATRNKASEFAEKLASASGKDGFKETLGKLSEEFIDISKTHAKDAAHTDFTRAVINDKTSAAFSDTVSHMVSYADDIVEKAASSPQADAVKKLVNKKALSRFGMNIAMYAAVMTFLQIIPRIYNRAEGKNNAGLKGLMKEETLNHKEDQSSANKDNAKDKSNPSFGSLSSTASSAVEKLTGEGLAGKIVRGGIEYSGPNVSFPLLLGIMGFGIVAPRIKNAKDKYDREEILRRDVTTCAVMCFAEKMLRKGFSKVNEKNSGLVLANKEAGFENKSIYRRVFDYLRPINGVNVMTTDQIISKYSGLDKYKDGITGFCDFIDGQGGNLKKVFSLTDDSKNIVSTLLENEGKALETADNKTIKEVLAKAKESEEVKKLIDLFKGTTKETNPWINKAKTLNARFTALSVLVLVPVFLGFMLPWINEKATKKRINEENNAKNNIDEPFSNSRYFINSEDKKGVFSDIKA